MNGTAELRPGWPADTGPMKLLTDLGLLPEGTRHLPCSTESTIHVTGGTRHYKAKCNYLNHQVIRALAALTLEGWRVSVQPAGPNLKISISAQKTL